MNVINFNDKSSSCDELIDSFHRGHLIPIVGSGFTKGCNTSNDVVPDGSQMQHIMIKEICKSNEKLSLSDFESRQLRFSQVADYFYRFVSEERQHEIIRKKFLNVKLSYYKKLFLKVNWPYIYTLNIDDAIEKNSAFNKVLPYKKLTEDIKLLSCVFKLHGDAFHEISYPEEQNIIFSQEQYIKSLEKNKTMLTLFQSDYSDKNIIFIGCSLQDELDLNYIITTNKNINHSNVSRFFITTEEPDPIKTLELEQFGINNILIIDDYEAFYEYLYNNTKEAPASKVDVLQDYKNPKIDFLSKGIEENKLYLQGFAIMQNEGHYKLPDFTIKREVSYNILDHIEKNTLNLLVGRRVSGKTTTALVVAKSIKNKEIYFFPSNISLSEREINYVLERENAVIIFDSNSISYQDAYLILKSIDKLKSNNSNILFTINSSDRLMFALLSSPEQLGYYELSDKYTYNESNELNQKLSSLGLTNFERRQSILENFFRYSQIYNHDILNLPSFNTSEINDIDLKILIILAAMDKIYSVVFNLLDIKYSDIEKCLTKLEPVIQKEYPGYLELDQHSGFKTIANCKSWIYSTLSQFTKSSQSIERVANVIFEIVEATRYSPKHATIYKNILLFDTLNQIFYKKQGGVINLIFLIYEKLETLLFEDGHYWLQRAKSILYLKRNAYKDLLISLDYAKKAHYDSNEDKKLKNNSTLTIAQVLGRLGKLEQHTTDYVVKEATSWYFEALQPNQFNKKYIDNVVKKAQTDLSKNDLYSLVSFLLKYNIDDHKLKRQAAFLVNLVITKKDIPI